MSETYKAIEVRKPGEFAEVRRPLQEPGHDQVRIRVEACGVCHSDAATVEGSFPGIAYPRGAHHFIDSAATDAGAALQRLGGAKVILITASGGKTVAETFRGLRPEGVSIVL